MALFANAPTCGTRQNLTTTDALNHLEMFNAVKAIGQLDANPELCGNPDDTAAWRKLVWDGVIACAGDPMEIDFFDTAWGGASETAIDAKTLYFRYNCDVDMNIFAQNAVLAPSAGAATTFQLLKANHTGSGKFSYPAKGFSLYIYEDHQWVSVTNKNTDNDFAHTFEVKPYRKDYRINIRKGKKMMVLPVQLVGGLSCPTPTSTHQSNGYSQHVRPYRLRKDWEFPIDLMRGYEEIMQWAIMFDENNNEVDSWELFEKTAARRDFKWAKNLIFWMGQTIDNPALLGNGSGQVTVDYGGFDGYQPTMFNGGGQVADFDAGVGWSLSGDLEPIIIRNDALKRTNEFVVMHGLQWWLGMMRNASPEFKNNAGGCTFDTFVRSGLNNEDVKKLGVRSYSWANFTLHFKQISAVSDSRGIGNYNFPHQANFIPGNGLKDSKGRSIPAIQRFKPRGVGATGMMEEYNRDMRGIDGCDKLAGYLAETIMQAIHCPHLHILANPILTA